MTDFDAIDFFRDESGRRPVPVLRLRCAAQCPVRREPHHDVMMVTGYDEAIAVYSDTDTFSSCNSRRPGRSPVSRSRSRATTSTRSSSSSTATSCR